MAPSIADAEVCQIGDLPHPGTADVYDIIIVGGGTAGVGAAIGARQAAPKARILMIESQSCLGGAATHRNVLSFCGLYTLEEKPKKAIGAIWDELKQKLLDVNATTERPVRHRGIFQVVDPEGVKVVLDEMMAEYKIDILLHTQVVGATRSTDNTLASVIIQERRGQRSLSAKAFVDCSGDCDLAYHAGASVRYGNHGAINLGSLGIRFGGLPDDVTPKASIWRDAIIAAKKNNPELCKLIPKNESVLIRLPLSGDVATYLASASYDARLSSSVTRAEISGRQQAQIYLKILRRLPGHEKMYIASTGPNFGTRESRHINAVYQLTEDDIMSGRHFEDVIALGAWGFEYHDETHETWASTFKYVPNKTFDVPLRCLQSSDTPNLFAAGRCVDGDQWAGSAVRVMGTALATGQAAGMAAGFVAAKGAKGLVVGEVQACLRNSGALLSAGEMVDGGLVDHAP